MGGRIAMDYTKWYWCPNCKTVLLSHDLNDTLRGLLESMERTGVDPDCEVHVVRVVMER